MAACFDKAYSMVTIGEASGPSCLAHACGPGRTHASTDVTASFVYFSPTEDVLRTRRAMQALVSSKLRVQMSADETNVRVVRSLLRRTLHPGSLADAWAAWSTLGATTINSTFQGNHAVCNLNSSQR